VSTASSSLSIHFDWKPLVSALDALKRPALDRAVALALVDSAKAANVKAASSIARWTGLKTARIKKSLTHDRVRVGDYKVNLRSSRKLIPLIDFRTSQTARGVRAAKPYGKAQVFKGTFIATMPGGGHRGVFRRVGKKRLPIQEMMGPSIHGSYAQPDVRAAVTATVKQRLPRLLARRIRAEQRRRG
jgi:Prophage minor tail protein Z (GPZ)